MHDVPDARPSRSRDDVWQPSAADWPDLLPSVSMSRAEQVAHVIRKIVQSGVIPAGRPVPGAERIARRYGVTKATASRALRALLDEGLLRRVHDMHGYRNVVCDQRPEERT